MKASKRRTMALYLGWDGSYVLSKRKLRTFYDDGGEPFLATGAGKQPSCIDLGREGALLFGALKLKPLQVVRLTVEVGE